MYRTDTSECHKSSGSRLSRESGSLSYPVEVRIGSPSFAGGRAPTGLGQVEYRLARDSVVRDFHKGRLSRIDVCDAQRELLRVAEHLGHETEIDCPICEEAHLVHVTFAFGPGLPPSGRALGHNREIVGLARANPDASFYIVEVCRQCSWNHLVRMFTAAAARRRPLS